MKRRASQEQPKNGHRRQQYLDEVSIGASNSQRDAIVLLLEPILIFTDTLVHKGVSAVAIAYIDTGAAGLTGRKEVFVEQAVKVGGALNQRVRRQLSHQGEVLVASINNGTVIGEKTERIVCLEIVVHAHCSRNVLIKGSESYSALCIRGCRVAVGIDGTHIGVANAETLHWLIHAV